jgi:hypothetical protein
MYKWLFGVLYWLRRDFGDFGTGIDLSVAQALAQRAAESRTLLSLTLCEAVTASENRASSNHSPDIL